MRVGDRVRLVDVSPTHYSYGREAVQLHIGNVGNILYLTDIIVAILFDSINDRPPESIRVWRHDVEVIA